MAEAVPIAHARAASPGLIVALCFGIAMLEGYDIQAMGVAAPKMIPALGLAPDQAGWAFSASMIGLVMGSIVGGFFADRFGRRPVLVISVVAFGLFSLATAFASDFPSLFLVRVATGLGLGGAVPNLIAIASEISQGPRRAFTTTLMFCGMPSGGSLAALLAAKTLDVMDWRMVFVIGGLIPLVIAPLVFFRLPETKPQRSAREGLSAEALRALFVGRQLPTTMLLWASCLLTLLVLYLLLNWLPILAVAKGVERAQAANTAVAYNVGSIVGALFLGKAVERFGFRIPLGGAYALAVATMLALALAQGYWALVWLSAFAGFLIVGSNYVLYAAASVYYPPTVRGTCAGAAVSVGRLGSIAGPIIAGQMMHGGATANQVLGVLVPVALGAGVAFLLMSFIGKEYPA